MSISNFVNERQWHAISTYLYLKNNLIFVENGETNMKLRSNLIKIVPGLTLKIDPVI
jgi:hypothetical protein